MVEELIKKLLESGVHFGHQTQRWNPKMKRFIFGQRSGIYIIDLEKTVDHLNQARDFVQEVTTKGGTVLFIGTKKQAQDIIIEEAKRCEMYHITNRWLGGLLTNFQTVKKSIERLFEIEDLYESGMVQNLTKKEVSRLSKEKNRLLRDLGGIRDMKKTPDVVFIVDPKKEDIAVREANKLGIPIIAIVDTNCDPDVVTLPIPGNDDALKSIKFITSLIADSAVEGRKAFAVSKPKEVKKEAAKDASVKKEKADKAKSEPKGEDKAKEPSDKDAAASVEK